VKKNSKNKLELKRITIRVLICSELADVVGGQETQTLGQCPTKTPFAGVGDGLPTVPGGATTRW
jgi:hypothetical protein